MLFYNNAAKIFGVKEVLRRRLENLDGKWYMQHAGSAVYTGLPTWVYFLKKVSSREDCAEDYWVYYIYPIYELSANIIPRGLAL